MRLVKNDYDGKNKEEKKLVKIKEINTKSKCLCRDKKQTIAMVKKTKIFGQDKSMAKDRLNTADRLIVEV